MTYNVKLSLIRKLAHNWLHHYHWTLSDLIRDVISSEDYTKEEKNWILGQDIVTPYNKRIRLEKCLIREVLSILPISGIPYYMEYEINEN